MRVRQEAQEVLRKGVDRKEAGSRLLYLTRGPSIPSVAEAITAGQMVSGMAAEWMGVR